MEEREAPSRRSRFGGIAILTEFDLVVQLYQ